MDTPEKSQRSTSTSHFEGSPVFCYISNLSPIQPVKSIPNTQAFNSLNFASPPSLFTSPHTNSHEETEFFKRNHCTYASKPEFSDFENEENTNEGTSDAFQQCDLCTEQLECLSPDNLTSGNCGITTVRHIKCSKLKAGLPNSLKYGCGSLDDFILPCSVTKMDPEIPCDVMTADTAPQMASTSASHVQDASKEKIISLESDVELAQNFQVEQREAAGCDWQKFSDAAGLLINDLSILEESSEGQDCMPVDSGMTPFPAVLQPLHDNIKDLSADSANSCEQCNVEIHATHSEEAAEPSMTDQVPETLSSTLLESNTICDLVPEMGNEEAKSIQSSGKRVFNQQRSVRRLVFEMSGVHKRTSIHDNSGSSSILLQSNCKLMLSEKQKVPARSGNGYLSTMLPGIGLRLNAFASTSNNVSRFKQETLASGGLLSMPSSNSSSNPSVSGQKALLSNEDFIEKYLVLHDDEAQVMKDDISSFAASEQFNQDSPEKKRRKSDDAEERDLCKRCNCKKSKCLKLYCECFAAGLYCVDPCSCQDCFNKPSHEDTVLETRRQIESRNPLAFAPKVIRSSMSVAESGDNSITTPASARHKRGCNCKKSNCLKKYCECFQGGVGCSIGCRCEGCKNTFGRKDGMDETEFKGEETETCENNASVTNAENNLVQEGEEEHLDTILPITPTSEIARPLVRLPFSFGSKPLQASLITARSSSQLCTSQGREKSDSFSHLSKFEKRLKIIPKDEIEDSNCSPTKGVSSSSPNCKRMSPPHCKSGSSLNWRNSRKLILRSIPSFPSLVPQHGNNNSSQQPS